MAFSNLTQVLMRNIEELYGKSPLLINMPADNFVLELQQVNPDSQISCFNNNIIDFNGFKSLQRNAQLSTMTCQFDSHYQSTQYHDLVIIAFPKSKAELAFTLAMLSANVNDASKVVFVGENKGGIKSVAKLSSDFIDDCVKVDAARHCIMFAGNFKANKQTFELEQWYQHYTIEVNGEPLTIAALPGVFSQNGLDQGTKVLLENLPEISGKCLDFGCGAGVISAVIGKKYPQVTLHLLDVSALAIASAKQTLMINNLSGFMVASNGLTEINETYDHIVSNPPFHQGIKTHYAATETFLNECKRHLVKRGKLTVVANSFLRYQPLMENNLSKTSIIAKSNGFNLYHCIK